MPILNSIAFMSNGPSKQALALAAAIAASGHNSAEVAEHMGVSAGLVSQWITGRRPIPPERAPKLAAFVGLEPHALSDRYAEISSQVVNGPRSRSSTPAHGAEDPRRSDLVIARLENDIDSLRYALGALVAVMTVHRPAEGVAVAKTLRKSVPAKFVKQGYIAELLDVLER
jgi:DNA-binding transcriptional regulator YdaS (Cro superfamily)